MWQVPGLSYVAGVADLTLGMITRPAGSSAEAARREILDRLDDVFEGSRLPTPDARRRGSI